MWYAGEFGNIINFDFIKRSHIRKASSIDISFTVKLRDFVICGLDAGDNEPKIIRSFDTYAEAEAEMLHLLVNLNSKK